VHHPREAGKKRLLRRAPAPMCAIYLIWFKIMDLTGNRLPAAPFGDRAGTETN
jgi:hypothetical protein